MGASDLNIDVFDSTKLFTVRYWSDNTLNTPFKQGITGYGAGIVYSILNSGWGCQLVQTVVDGAIYYRGLQPTGWSIWTKV